MNQKVSVAIVILIVVGMTFYLNLGPSVPDGYVDYRAVEAQSALAEAPDVLILDVRTPGEYQSGHIPGAQNIDFRSPDFETRLKALDRDAQYFVYCRTGNRSGVVLAMMQRLGFTWVWHLAKGIVDWKGAGLPLER